jgi:hypothetical protein
MERNFKPPTFEFEILQAACICLRWNRDEYRQLRKIQRDAMKNKLEPFFTEVSGIFALTDP